MIGRKEKVLMTKSSTDEGMARVNGRNLSAVAEVLGTGSDGTEPSLVLSVRRHGEFSADVSVVARLLFNCGEGTQRLCGENGVKLRSLDSLFLTRLDALSVSGVPGIIFSLGSLGAPRLRLHGPVGLSGFLGAIRSFVRRKYPQIECVHVKSESAAEPPPVPQDGVVLRPDWNSSGVIDDDYARVAAVVLDTSNGKEDRVCSFCENCPDLDSSQKELNAAKTSQNQSRAVAGLKTGREGARNDDEHDEFKKWLILFYESKEPAKVPYVDVILNRYRGRYDDLKDQLTAKYGDIDTSSAKAESKAALTRATSGSSSDSSSDSDSDSDNDSECNNSTKAAYDVNTPLNREWLIHFYQLHQPDRLVHIDKVLKQFQGREETLKRMLLQKYSVSTSTHPQGKTAQPAHHETSDEPSQKKPRLGEAAPILDSNTTVDVPTSSVFEEPRASQSHRTHQQCPQCVCYSIWFKHHPEPYPVVWVIDCQSVEQISSLLSHFPSRKAGCTHRPTLVAHFTPRHVRIDPRYSAWMEELSSDGASDNPLQHLVFDADHLQVVENGAFSLSFLSSAKAAVRRDAVSTSETKDSLSTTPSTALSNLAVFLDKAKALEPHQRQRQIVLQSSASSLNSKAHIAQSKLQFLVASHRKNHCGFLYEHSGWAKYSYEEEGVNTVDGEEENSSNIHQQKTKSPAIPANCPRLIILGTGSAAPSKLRASSSIYVEMDGVQNCLGDRIPALLLDCGEGTYGQLWRQFGDATSERIASLRLIWISHHHADHQCGLVRILYEYCRFYAAGGVEEKTRRLVVTAPQSVLSYVSHWLPAFPDANNLIAMVSCRDFNDRTHPFRQELLSDPEFSISDMHSVPVRHCYDSYGLVLTSRAGKKLVYSGDTQPCDILVRAGMNASLLIHEATFDDDMEQDACSKRHSTVGQALEVARRMNAAHVILTHFSQRYPSLPPSGSGDSSGAVANSAGSGLSVDCAFDGFSFPLLTWL